VASESRSFVGMANGDMKKLSIVSRENRSREVSVSSFGLNKSRVSHRLKIARCWSFPISVAGDSSISSLSSSLSSDLLLLLFDFLLLVA